MVIKDTSITIWTGYQGCLLYSFFHNFFLTSFTHFNILLQNQNNSLMKLFSSVGIKKVLGQKGLRLRVSHILQSPLNQLLGNLSLLFLVLTSLAFLHFSILRFAFTQLSKSFIPFLVHSLVQLCCSSRATLSLLPRNRNFYG